MNPAADVYAFMRVGQPDQLPTELQPLDAPPEVVRELLDTATVLQVHTSRFKRLPGVLALRARLMCEELGEMLRAMGDGDMVEVADGLADLEYVTVGTALALGIDHERVWDAVQQANMGKYPLCEACNGLGSSFPRDLASLFPSMADHANEEAVQSLMHVLELCYFGGVPLEDATNRIRLFENPATVYPFLNLRFVDVKAMYTRLDRFLATAPCPACDGTGRTAIRDAQGKVLKPPGWTPPDIKGVLYGASAPTPCPPESP